jgi:ATP-dependent DNA ligase
VEEHGRELFEAAQRLALEGIVAKRKADPHRPETVWYKTRAGSTARVRAVGSCSRDAG